jgi:hypothetical protein
MEQRKEGRPMAILEIRTPTIRIESPAGWVVGIVPGAVAVMKGVQRFGFIPNVVVLLEQVDPSATIQASSDKILSEHSERNVVVMVRDSRVTEEQMDQVLLFTVGEYSVVRYQRMLLVDASLGAKWMVRIEATCDAKDEADIKADFVEILNSLTVN